RWLLTYADMITLLLALFIILFAISNISRVKFQRLATAISGGFSGTDALNAPPGTGRPGKLHDADSRASLDDAQLDDVAKLANQVNLAAVKARLDRYIQAQKLQSKVQTRIDKQGLVITLLSDKTYYDSGSAQLRPRRRSCSTSSARRSRGSPTTCGWKATPTTCRSRRPRIRRTGSCPPRARPASRAISWSATSFAPRASRSPASASTARASPTTRPSTASKTAASTS